MSCCEMSGEYAYQVRSGVDRQRGWVRMNNADRYVMVGQCAYGKISASTFVGVNSRLPVWGHVSVACIHAQKGSRHAFSSRRRTAKVGSKLAPTGLSRSRAGERSPRSQATLEPSMVVVPVGNLGSSHLSSRSTHLSGQESIARACLVFPGAYCRTVTAQLVSTGPTKSAALVHKCLIYHNRLPVQSTGNYFVGT